MLLLVFWYGLIGAFALMPPVYGALWVTALGIAFVGWFALRPSIGLRRRATLRLRRPLGDMRLVWLAAPAQMVLNLALLLLASRVVTMPNGDDPISKYAEQQNGWLAVAIFVIVVGPIIEEFTFRGLMQRKLERLLGPGVAIWTTSVVFALAHWQLGGFPSRVAAGLMLGYLAYVTRSIWPGVLLHMLANGGVVALAVLPGGDAAFDRAATRWPVTLASIVAAALSIAAIRVLALRLTESVRVARQNRQWPRGAPPHNHDTTAAAERIINRSHSESID